MSPFRGDEKGQSQVFLDRHSGLAGRREVVIGRGVNVTRSRRKVLNALHLDERT